MNTDQPTEAKPHNPANLSPEQVGVSEGWRLLDEDEVGESVHPTIGIDFLGYFEQWQGAWYGDDPLNGLCDDITYRTKLTRAELRKARGLEPEPPPRYFVDSRIGCIAVRDREKTDPDYPGLHQDTEGVVWYRHGQKGDDVWWVAPDDITEANVVCDRLNAVKPEQPKPVTPSKCRHCNGDVLPSHLPRCVWCAREITPTGELVTAEKPVTPESLAREYIATTPNDWAVSCAIVKQREFDAHRAGYRANAERNADLALRLDLAEEALKRYGFELGVANDVPTWVPRMKATSLNREALGQRVREVWLYWARNQPNPKPSWLVQWPELPESDREVDRLIGETVAHESTSFFRAENATLQTAAADYAKAAEASAALVEKLTRERDEAIHHAGEWLVAECEATNQVARLENERDTLRAELSAANAALEKERAEVERLKGDYEDCCVNRTKWQLEAQDARRQLAEAKEKNRNSSLFAELALWQAVVGKKDAALRHALSCRGGDGDCDFCHHATAALSTPPATALLAELERAWKEGWSAAAGVAPPPVKQEAWLASDTRKRHSGATEAGACKPAEQEATVAYRLYADLMGQRQYFAGRCAKLATALSGMLESFDLADTFFAGNKIAQGSLRGAFLHEPQRARSLLAAEDVSGARSPSNV